MLCGQLLSLFSVWTANHFYLFTTQRFEHTVHVLLLTYIPSSLTPVQPVTYIPTEHISNHSSPPQVLSMYLGMVAGQFKVMAKPNYTLHTAHSLCMSSSVLKLKPTAGLTCTAIAHSTKLLSMRIPSTCEMYQGGIVGVCPLFQ